MMSVREHMALDIEARHWPRRAIGRKDAAIFELTGMTPVKHAQVVLGLIERADVVAEYPVLCARLRRLREARAAERTPGDRLVGRRSPAESAVPRSDPSGYGVPREAVSLSE